MMSRSYLPTDSQDTYSEFEVVYAVQFIPMGQEKLENFLVTNEWEHLKRKDRLKDLPHPP